jgi:hypothetical protein
MSIFKRIIKTIVSWFTSDRAGKALEQAAALVPEALPIVKQITLLTPTRADDEIIAAFEKFAIPGAQEFLATPIQRRGYVLLQLATAVLAARFPGVATNILNTAIQFAVTGLKA